MIEQAAKAYTASKSMDIAHVWADKLRDEGIIKEMHVGLGDEMQDGSARAVLLTLEWFAGGFIVLSDPPPSPRCMTYWIDRSGDILREAHAFLCECDSKEEEYDG